MSARRSPRLRAKHIELLQAQQAHLLVLRDRHRRWMKDADDIEVRRIYRKIAASIKTTVDQYDHLLDTLQSQRDNV